MGYGDTALAALNKGFMGLSHGITGPLMESGIFGPGIAEQSKLMAKRRNEQYQQALQSHPNVAQGMMMAGAIPNAVGIAAMGAPLVGSAARAVASRIPQAIASNPYAHAIGKLAGGGAGAATWGALDYPESGETRMGNALSAAPYGVGLGAAGMAAQKGGEYLGATINKVRNAKAGNYKPEHAQIMKAAKKHGIDILPADLYPKGGTIATATELAEKTPFINIVGKRKEQNAQATLAAKNAVREQEAKMTKSSFGEKGSLDNIEKIAKGNSKRAPAAKQLLQDIKASGDDWTKIIQTSGNVSHFEKKLHADMLSDKVAKMAGNAKILPRKSNDAISGALRELESSKIPNKPLKKMLKDMQNEDQEMNFKQMRDFRSDLGGLINDYYKGKNALIGEKGVHHLQSIKNALDEDMGIFAKNHSPELSKAYNEFNSYYKEKVIPYKDTQLAKALKNSNPDEIYNSFIKLNDIPKGQGTDRAEKFYKALDKKGQEAVKTGFLNNGLQKAMNPDTGVFSPAKFSTYLKKNQPVRSFFDKEGKKDINDLQKLMRAVQRSGQMKEPATGYSLIKYGLAAAAGKGLITSPGLTLAALLASYALKRFTGSSSLAKLIAASPKQATKYESFGPLNRKAKSTKPPEKIGTNHP